MSTIQWNIAVSEDTDQSVRRYLAGQGDESGRYLSRFIEEAVRAHILELSADAAKAANRDVFEAELSAVVAESLEWARSR